MALITLQNQESTFEQGVPDKINDIMFVTDNKTLTGATVADNIKDGSDIFINTLNDAARIYGKESLVYKACESALDLNIQNNISSVSGVYKGRLRVRTVDYTPATACVYTTPDISANLANFKLLTDGYLSITINSSKGGSDQLISGLDYTIFADVTLESIAADLSSRIKDVVVSVNSDGISLDFTTNKYGADASITFDALSGTGTSLMSADLLGESSAGAVTNGVDDVLDIDKMIGTGWKGFSIIPLLRLSQPTQLNLIEKFKQHNADYTNTSPFALYLGINSMSDASSDGVLSGFLGDDIDSSYSYIHPVASITDNHEKDLTVLMASTASILSSVDYSNQDGVLSLQGNKLEGVTPSDLLPSEETTLKDYGCDVYTYYNAIGEGSFMLGRIRKYNFSQTKDFESLYKDAAYELKQVFNRTDNTLKQPEDFNLAITNLNNVYAKKKIIEPFKGQIQADNSELDTDAKKRQYENGLRSKGFYNFATEANADGQITIYNYVVVYGIVQSVVLHTTKEKNN